MAPVDRGKRGIKRSVVVDAAAFPVRVVPARAIPPLLAPTLDALATLGPLPERMTVHLDRGYDWAKSRTELAGHGKRATIAERGKPAPVTAGLRWIAECTNAWQNAFKKLSG